MDVNIILKIIPQQRPAKIFHQVFECLHYLHLKPEKISLTYREIKICECLTEHTRKINNFKKQKNEEQQESKTCYICKKTKKKYLKDKKYYKVRDHCHYTEDLRGPPHSICNLKCSLPKKKLYIFHNGSNYHYHFLIKELAEDFQE